MATGTPSNKTALKKGFGLMDWVKLTTSTTDLTGMMRMGGMRGYRMEEVAKHKTARDAWAVFGGKVYNLTPYLPYHPGGAGIIVKTAGTDCTVLFNKHHPWVNLDGLAGKLIIGYVIEEEGASNGAAAAAPAGAAAPPTAQTAPATLSTSNGAGVGGGAETSPPPAEASKGSKPKPASSVFAMDPPPIPPKRISISAAFGTKEEEEEEEEEGVERKEEEEVGKVK